MWHGLSVVGCVLVLSGCGGGGGVTPVDNNTTNNDTTNNNTASAAQEAALQRQSEMGTAALGTARLQ